MTIKKIHIALLIILSSVFFSAGAIAQNKPQTKIETTTELQRPTAAQDPFKKFYLEKISSSNSSVKLDNTQGSPIQSSKDPFKTFLEKQEQTKKDQHVLPFGKNQN
jgi:hypothetical protein